MTVENDLGDAPQKLALGLDPSATTGVDASFGEGEETLPPSPPGTREPFFARLVGTFTEGVDLPDDGMLVDVRQEESGFPVEKTYGINFQAGKLEDGTEADEVTFTWKLPDGVSGTIQDTSGFGRGVALNESMSDCGSATLDVLTVDGVIVTLTYNQEAEPDGQRRVKVCGADGQGNDEGWRLLALPSEADRSALEDDIGEDDTGFSLDGGNLIHEWEGGSSQAWDPVENSSEVLPRGEGFIMYFFDDSVDPLETAGITLDVPSGPEDQQANVTVDNLGTDQQFQLLGNPYNLPFSLGALAGGDLPGEGYQATVQVWDPETGQFTPLTQGVGDNPPDALSAWQGFFVEQAPSETPASSLTFNADGRQAVPSGLIGGSPKARGASEEQATVKLALEGEASGNEILRDELQLFFSERSSPGWDAYEASQLSPPGSETQVTLTSPLQRKGETVRRVLASEPYPTRTDSASVPLSAEATGIGGAATLRWRTDARDQVPEGWTVELEDTQTGARIDLREEPYQFDVGEGKDLSAPGEARFRVHAVPSSLPARISAFDAGEEDGSIHLNWSTDRERKSEGFAVQRKAGNGSWERLGFVESKVSGDVSSEPRSYQFADEDPPYAADSLAYRLRLVGTDGVEHLTEERTVRRSVPGEVELRAPAPNPASQQATVHFAVPNATDLRIALYDLLGRQVATVASGRVDAGRHQRQVSTRSLAAGTYFLQLRADQEIQSQKLTVVR